jgi:hypothetical protein
MGSDISGSDPSGSATAVLVVGFWIATYVLGYLLHKLIMLVPW